MWGKKIPEPDDSIPDDIIEEVFERIRPQIENLIVQHVQGAVGSSLEQFKKKELAPILSDLFKKMSATSSELENLKKTSGYSFEKIMRDLLSAQNYAVASHAAKEVIDGIGISRIELFETYITELEKSVDELQEQIEALEKSLKGVKSSADETLAELKKERAELSGMRKELSEFLATTKKRISVEIEAIVSDIKQNLSLDTLELGKIIRESVNAIVSDELSKIEERLQEAVQDIHSTAESVTGLAVAAENMSSLEKAVEELASEIKELSVKVSSLESKLQSSLSLEEMAELVKKKQNAVTKPVDDYPIDEVLDEAGG